MTGFAEAGARGISRGISRRTRVLAGLWSGLAMMALPAAAVADAWLVDHDASSLTFEGLENGSRFQGQFDRFQADIRFDPGALDDSHVSVVVDTSSFDTGIDERDSIATGVYWFDVNVFPEAHFVVTEITHVDGSAFEAAAELTIRDRTAPVVLPFDLIIDGNTARMTGEVDLNRRAFGLGRGDGDIELVVGLQVTVGVDLTAVRAP